MNGNGFTISNLTIQQSQTNDVGLFGATATNSVIQYVILKNVNINIADQDNVGAIVGYNEGTIENSLTEGTVKGNNFVGGLIGYNNNGNITFLLSTVTVEGKENVGGVIGYNHGGTIENASATKNVQGTGNNVGGLIGKSENGAIINSTAAGDVNGFFYIGGLVGQNTNGQITNAYATGNVNGTWYVGGLIGENIRGKIESTYATGKVTGSTYIGGLVGISHEGYIMNSYAIGEVLGGMSSIVGGLVGISASQITNTYATGNVTGSGYVGGLIGQMAENVEENLNSFAFNAQININNHESTLHSYIGKVIGHSNYPNFSNIYALNSMILNITNPSDKPIFYGANGTEISMEDAQKQQTYVALGWDFNQIWKIGQNGYPTLQTTEEIGAAGKSTLTLQSNPSNAGTLTGQGHYEPGTEINLMAQPNTGYQFVNWTIDNVELNDQPTVPYTISPGNITIMANFQKVSKMLTLSVNNPTGGTITKGANGNYEYDAEIELQATPNEGYRFVKWVINGTTEITDSSFTYNMPAHDVDIIAYFERQAYQVTVKANDAKGGTVTGASGSYLFEEQIQLQASPNEGYRFVNWTIDGVEVSNDPTFTYTIPAEDVEIVANFEKIPTAVKVEETPNELGQVKELLSESNKAEKDTSASILPITAMNFMTKLVVGFTFLIIGIGTWVICYKKRVY